MAFVGVRSGKFFTYALFAKKSGIPLIPFHKFGPIYFVKCKIGSSKQTQELIVNRKLKTPTMKKMKKRR